MTNAALPVPTPAGTPTIAPAAPTTATEAQVQAAIAAALNATPPSWGWSTLPAWVRNGAYAAAAPLLLTAYNSGKQLLEGPAQLKAIEASVAASTKDIESMRALLSDLKKQVDDGGKISAGLGEKVDRLIWLQQTNNGEKAWPASRPVP